MENTNLIIEPHRQQESLSETQTRQRSNETTSLRPTIPPACIDAISKEPTEAIVKSSSTTVAANVRNYLLEPPLQLSELILEDNYDPLRWPEVFIAIRGLAYGTTTRALYKRFSQEGNIVSVTIHSDLRSRDGNSRRRGAIIRFCPAPADCFWRYGVLSIDIGVGRPWQVQAWLDLQRHADGRVPSPVKTGITYPELSSLTLDSIAFGFMSDAHTFVPMHTAHATEALPALVTLNLRRKYLEIQFHVQMIDTRPRETPRHGAHDRTVEYRMRIPLYQIPEIYEIVHSPEHYALFLDQDTPPLFYKKSENIESTFDDKASHWNERCIWNRETDIVYDEEEMRRAPISLHRSQSIVDPGRWKAYHISFHRSDINPYTYDLIMSALEDFNVRKAPLDPFVVQKARQRSVWQWIDRPGTDQTSLKLALAGLQGIGLLPFSVRYQLEVCISQDVLNEYTLNCAFIERLFSLGEDRATILLEDVAAQGLRVYEPMSIYDINFNKYHKRTKIPHYCTPMRKAVITPTTIYYTSPTLETSNRVIRQYAQYGDRFLRVQFTDEKLEGRIHSNDGNEAEEVFRRIRQALENGLTIGDRHYEFLAFSNSQFREHGAYFISPDTNFSTTIVLDWMGQFDSIKTVARYAARLGQCFSTTRAINGTRVAIAQIEDIKRNGYNFTDGVGKISSFVAKMIASELNIHSYGVPSVFQFRLGGCKGVLALCPSARENRLYIRTSQYKFPAAHEGLEIIRWSKFAAAFLNRQLIIVLSALGVKDDIFLSKQEKMLLQLDEAMVNETTALSLLQKHVDANAMTLTLATMIQDGFMGTQEPFLRSVLQLWRAWSIKNLKERARIVVDDGAFVLGCTDETATLQGYFNSNLPRKETTLQERIDMLPQIFIQVPDPQLSGSYTVRKGPCILARNPSLHPGDIRVVNAVDVEGLHHLRDVVVLPQTGDCDLASMCSGGDLDGDDYFVSWDLDLLPEEWFHPAMNYTTTKAVTVESVTMAQVKDFFVEYMKNDKLPTIAHAHLGHADIEWDGVKSSKCLRLAELHSKAVDFAKTGQAAQMPKDLHVRYWPHFMEKRFKEKYQVYKSEKVLGQLYDGVKRVEFVPLVDAEPDSRIFEGFKRIEETMNEIRKIKVAYDTGLRRIMAQQSIGTEFEVWTTFVLKHNKQGSDYKYHEEIGQLSGALRDQYRHACIIAAGGKTPDVLEPFVAAMYVATSEEMLEAREKREEGNTTDSPLISFPWLFPEVLGKIARRGRQPTTIALKESIPASNLNAMLANPKPMFRSGKFHDDIETTEGVTHRGEVLKLFEDAKHTPNSRDAGADSDEAVTPPSIYSLESNQAILPITSSSASDLQLLSTSRWLDSLTSAPVQSRQLDDTPQALLPGKPINPFSYDAQGDRKPWLEEQTKFVSLNSVEEPKSRSQVSDVPAHMHIKVYEEHENVGSEHCSASMPVIQDSQISPFNAEDEPEFSDDQVALLSTREGNLESVGIIHETAGTKSIEIVEEDLDRNRMPSEEVLQIGSS